MKTRYAILSDIHSNLPALQAVLRHLESTGPVDGIWCLGDMVGYGPYPNQCIELLRQQKHLAIPGNHDWAAIGRLDTTDFNPDAATANRWTARQLTGGSRQYLEGLSETLMVDDFTLAHGSPRYPIWEYITSASIAGACFSYFQARFCLVGHTHEPALFVYDEGKGTCRQQELPEGLWKPDKGRWVINPGSVGQPRDGDPRASYLVYDDGEGVFYHHRVPYDITATQEKMMEEGLPSWLVERLTYGY